MVRSVVLARILQDDACLQICSMSRLLSQIVLKPYSSPRFSEIPSSFSSASTSGSGSAGTDEAGLKSLAEKRRQYEKKTSDLRKKYAADIQEKTLQKKKVEDQQRKEIEEQKAMRNAAKIERAAARAIEVAEEERGIQAVLQEQRAESAAHRARMEGRQGYIRFKRMEAIRRQSSMWIEEKNLERRILEAIANPYHLAGSVGSEPIDRDDSYYEADEEV